MLKRSSIAFRSRAGLILTIFIALGAFFFYLIKDDSSQSESAINDLNAAYSGKKKAVPRKDPSDTIFERILRGSTTGSSVPVVEGYIDRQNIEYPISALGVNEAAKAYFNLSDQQCDSINQIVSDARESLAGSVMDKMLVGRNPEDQVDSVYYVGDPAAYNATKERLFAQLESIAGKEFATAGVSVLKSDPRFLSGGEHSIYFYSIDGPRDRDPQLPEMDLIRLEFVDESGNRLEALTMSDEELRNQYKINFDDLLDKSD